MARRLPSDRTRISLNTEPMEPQPNGTPGDHHQGGSRPRVSQLVRDGLPVRADGKLEREAALGWLRRYATSWRLYEAAGGKEVALSAKDIEDLLIIR